MSSASVGSSPVSEVNTQLVPPPPSIPHRTPQTFRALEFYSGIGGTTSTLKSAIAPLLSSRLLTVQGYISALYHLQYRKGSLTRLHSWRCGSTSAYMSQWLNSSKRSAFRELDDRSAVFASLRIAGFGHQYYATKPFNDCLSVPVAEMIPAIGQVFSPNSAKHFLPSNVTSRSQASRTSDSPSSPLAVRTSEIVRVLALPNLKLFYMQLICVELWAYMSKVWHCINASKVRDGSIYSLI